MRFCGVARPIDVDTQNHWGFMKAGYVHPDRLQFKDDKVAAVRDIKPHRITEPISARHHHEKLLRESGIRSPLAGRVE